MISIQRYEEQVYAGVLGKVIGVYMGRPFEGWSKDAIVERFGAIDRYVAAERGHPLVVADDDISGTFTFVRAVEDSGRLAQTEAEDFGRSWLNYIMEGKSILWWGGLGISTEHTAFLRLKHGVPAPKSGSRELNGVTVSEQIGAQIFIDALGMIAPGDPALAAKLARQAACVSHDGEAVHGAVVVAAMVAAAFVEKDMERLLDIGVSMIPDDSLIARVHRDVRAWRRDDDDWEKTFGRIVNLYGYDRYGGGCHMVPNHAVMVMAWTYAPTSFLDSQTIVNTAGWDTDCNAANVGSVMGIKVGLGGINAQYDFQTPMADRIVLPTAEPSRHVTDCLAEALHIARIGRRVMGMPPLAAAKGGALYHFSLPGSRQGFMAEPGPEKTASGARVENTAGALSIDFTNVSPTRPVRISTPILAQPSAEGYAVAGAPRLLPGQTVTAHGRTADVRGGASARLFVRRGPDLEHGASVELLPNATLQCSLEIPQGAGQPVSELGIEIAGALGARGLLIVDRIEKNGAFQYDLEDLLPRQGGDRGPLLGWITDCDLPWPISLEGKPWQRVLCNDGRGVLLTGTDDLTDYEVGARIHKALVSRAGLVVRYQGLERYLAVVHAQGALSIVRRWYGRDEVLASEPLAWSIDERHRVTVRVRGREMTAAVDGTTVLRAEDDRLAHGGFGFLVEDGWLAFRELSARGA
jgi:ADP-ribosylglycohydrolase